LAPVAQLDRAPDYESGGWEFESLRARHFSMAYQDQSSPITMRVEIAGR
jgi:hypothetical protein